MCVTIYTYIPIERSISTYIPRHRSVTRYTDLFPKNTSCSWEENWRKIILYKNKNKWDENWRISDNKRMKYLHNIKTKVVKDTLMKRYYFIFTLLIFSPFFHYLLLSPPILSFPLPVSFLLSLFLFVILLLFTYVSSINFLIKKNG